MPQSETQSLPRQSEASAPPVTKTRGCPERLSADSASSRPRREGRLARKDRPLGIHVPQQSIWFESAAVRAMGFIRCTSSHPPYRDHPQATRQPSHEATQSRSEPPSRSHRSEPFPTEPVRADQITTNPWFYLPTDIQAFHRFQFYLATERLARGGGNHWQTVMEEARQAGWVAPYESPSQIADEGLRHREASPSHFKPSISP